VENQQSRKASEGVVREISADAEVVEVKALVGGSSFQFADPIEGLAFACCAARSEACHDYLLCFGERRWTDGVRRWIRADHWFMVLRLSMKFKERGSRFARRLCVRQD
jgi:hypothetical protein